jgi:hypothetical protein
MRISDMIEAAFCDKKELAMRKQRRLLPHRCQQWGQNLYQYNTDNSNGESCKKPYIKRFGPEVSQFPNICPESNSSHRHGEKIP